MEKPFLIGEQVYLRPFEKKYIDEGYGNLINDRNVIKYLPTNYYPKSNEELEQYIEKANKSQNTIFMAVFNKENEKYSGNVKLSIDWISRIAKYSRLLSDEVWNRGIGTELIRLIMFYAFEIINMRILETNVNVLNDGSVNSNIKAGMKKVSEIERYEFINGEYRNVVRFMLWDKDYMQLKKGNNFQSILKLNSIG